MTRDEGAILECRDRHWRTTWDVHDALHVVHGVRQLAKKHQSEPSAVSSGGLA